ncbi:hypothetical protein A5652_23345 [Mycobacterium sp. 1165178.9]|nr:hypothetical protein A5652_23345 [Mycobacterium sp. 1165178.9]
MTLPDSCGGECYTYVNCLLYAHTESFVGRFLCRFLTVRYRALSVDMGLLDLIQLKRVSLTPTLVEGTDVI